MPRSSEQSLCPRLLLAASWAEVWGWSTLLISQQSSLSPLWDVCYQLSVFSG